MCIKLRRARFAHEAPACPRGLSVGRCREPRGLHYYIYILSHITYFYLYLLKNKLVLAPASQHDQHKHTQHRYATHRTRTTRHAVTTTPHRHCHRHVQLQLHVLHAVPVHGTRSRDTVVHTPMTCPPPHCQHPGTQGRYRLNAVRVSTSDLCRRRTRGEGTRAPRAADRGLRTLARASFPYAGSVRGTCCNTHAMWHKAHHARTNPRAHPTRQLRVRQRGTDADAAMGRECF